MIIDGQEVFYKDIKDFKSIEGEIWKTIDGYPNYAISNKGRVLSKRRYIDMPNGGKRLIEAKLLTLSINHKGYYRVQLCRKGIYKLFFVHRLVANAYIQNIENKPQVNHIDGNKLNNCVENLEWSTNSENQKHAIKLGLKHHAEDSGIPKKAVKQINLVTGDVINIFPSLTEAARSVGQKSRTPIRFVCQGKRKQASGFGWQFD